VKKKIVEIHDGIEVNSCKDIGNYIEPFWPIEDADFFTVYLHRIEGGVDAFIDFPSYSDAMKVAKVIAETKNWEIIDNVKI
jgi:hypothetical protein